MTTTLLDRIGQENVEAVLQLLVDNKWDGCSELDEALTGGYPRHPLLAAVALEALPILRALLLLSTDNDDDSSKLPKIDVNAMAPCPGRHDVPVSALHVACLDGNFPAMQLLLQAGADANLLVPNDNGNGSNNNNSSSPLWKLTEHRNVLTPQYTIDRLRVMALQLSGEALEINQLNLACRRLLLQNGADPKLPDGEGQTLLLKDCQEGWYDGAKLLLEYRAHQNVSYNEYGPLDTAAMKLNGDLCALLGAHGVSFTFVDNNLPMPIQYAFKAGRDGFVQRLHHTIQAIVPLLPNPHVHASDGLALLHLLAQKLKQDDFDDVTETTVFEIVETIVRHGDRRQVDVPTRDLAQTPLMKACKADNHVMIRALLRHGADAQNTRDVHNRSSLFYARDSETIEMLVQAGGMLEERDLYGRTPLLECIVHHKARVECLLNSGSSVHVRDCHNWTPLHHAVFQGDADIVQMILDAFPGSIACRDEQGRTPLHLFGIMLALEERGPSGPVQPIEDYANFVDRLILATDTVVDSFEGYELLDADDLDVLELLFTNGADPIAKDDNGNLPFFFGARLCWDSSPVYLMVRQAALAGLFG